MKIFTENEAKYFCESFQGSQGVSEQSIRNFCRNNFRRRMTFREGSSKYTEYRDCMIRHIERLLFQAAANYHGAHKMMQVGTSGWAYVTLYYSSFYAASALLNMFGVWIDWPDVIEVNTGNIGQQEFIYQKSPNNVTTYKGSHRIFWDLFYSSISSLSAYIMEPHLMTGITPISNDPIWQIRNRNQVNYDPYESYRLANDFRQHFRSTKFPSSLPGILNTQYKITSSLNELVFNYANAFSLRSDALNLFPPKNSDREKRLNKLVFNSKNRVSLKHSQKKQIFGFAN